jgi:hypothetical protein
MIASSDLQTFRYLVISIFITSYLCLNIMWLCPSSLRKSSLFRPVRILCNYFGLGGSFSFFAPKPMHDNTSLIVAVYANKAGYTVWRYPQMYNLPLWERMFRERYRKYLHEHLARHRRYHLFLPDLARYAARSCNHSGYQATIVQIKKCRSSIYLPGEVVHGSNQIYEKTFFLYRVQPGDL